MGHVDYLRKLALVSLVAFTSCGGEKPIVCTWKKPTQETVTIHDTVFTERVVSDTVVVTKPSDTIVMEKERLRVRVVRIKDTLLIEGECQTDTIYRTKTVELPVQVKVVQSKWPWWAAPLLWAICVIAILYAVKRLLQMK
jgi:hypothetical protein